MASNVFINPKTAVKAIITLTMGKNKDSLNKTKDATAIENAASAASADLRHFLL